MFDVVSEKGQRGNGQEISGELSSSRLDDTSVNNVRFRVTPMGQQQKVSQMLVLYHYGWCASVAVHSLKR